MSKTSISRTCRRLAICAPIMATTLIGTNHVLASEPMANACPVDGCEVKILDVKPAGEELMLTFKANFKPDVSKNHLHVWWGEQYDIKQVGRNATTFGVEKGKWHRHDDYPNYTTTGAASTSIRDGAVTVCVTSADRNHNILDASLFHCVDASDHL
ncbi:MAG: hypothetical protein OES20_14890 [Gammaproteobacteria bacterium]|nr:hypothetical protein [Gammaproteobacteria bacterium]